ncbi:MAG: hypothetical protein AB8H86_03505 [Polyangiales bacterium]
MKSVSVCLLLLFACASDDAPSPIPANFGEACTGIPGCETPAIPLDAPPMDIWRVLVVRDGAGAIRIEEVHEISVSSAIGVPQGPLHGVRGLASLNAAGEPLEVQFVNFATTRFVEDFEGETREEDLTGLPVSMVGYLAVRADVQTLAIVEGDGSVEHSVPAPAPGEAVQDVEVQDSRALIQGVPTGPCAHVMILDGVEDAAWNASADYAHQAPTATQLALVRTALGRMTAVHCMGMGRIAFIDRPRMGSAGSVGSWAGDFVDINVNYLKDGEGFEWVGFDEVRLQDRRAQALFQGVILHEAAHATTFLLSALSDVENTFRGVWAPSERTLAADTIDRVRLRGDITRLWDIMHTSFMNQGWGDSYYGTGANYLAGRDMESPAGITSGGFSSPYGKLNVYEDIAEWATWPIAGALYDAAGIAPGPGALKRGYGCGEMSAYGSTDVPSGLAAAFTKITFMHDLGFVTDENYEACVGPALGLPNNAQGIAIYQDGDLRRVFGTGANARIGERDGQYVFVLEAEGAAEFDGVDYPATLTLEIGLGETSTGFIFTDDVPIDQISWPRGAFALGVGQPHAFRLRLDGEPAGNFDVTEGFVLAAASTNDRLVGSVFVTEAFRNQAPVPVPQVFDPPLQFRYLLEN